jgi:hypothetical protein
MDTLLVERWREIGRRTSEDIARIKAETDHRRSAIHIAARLVAVGPAEPRFRDRAPPRTAAHSPAGRSEPNGYAILIEGAAPASFDA